MHSERFEPAPPSSRENSACYPYAKPSNKEREGERDHTMLWGQDEWEGVNV